MTDTESHQDEDIVWDGRKPTICSQICDKCVNIKTSFEQISNSQKEIFEGFHPKYSVFKKEGHKVEACKTKKNCIIWSKS